MTNYQLSTVNYPLSVILLAVLWLSPIATTAQDLIAVSSITGGSSVFVFRSSSRQAKRFVTGAKPARSKAQRLETVKKIRTQYETIAKTTPRRDRAKVVDPGKLPPSAERTMPAAQVSVLFSGVGEFYLQKGDFATSFDFFRDAIRLDDKNVAAKTGFSEALAVQGNDLLVKDKANEAKAVFLEALKYDPKNSAAYFGLGEVYAQLDQDAEAIANYEKALQTDKDLTEIFVPLGIIYFQSGDIAKADELLGKALASSSAQTAETQYFLGMVRSAQNRNEEALAAFQKAKTLDPTYAEAFYNSAETLVRLKREREAIPDYQKAVALKTGYFDAALGLAEAQFAAEDFAAALNDFQSASRIKNDSWQVYSGWGNAFLKTGKFNDAAAKLNLAVTFLTRQKDFDKTAAADIYSKIGYAYGQQCEIDTALFRPCQWSAAIKALEKAIELTGDPLDNANLGWAYLNASRVDMAMRMIPEQQAKLELAKAALLKVVSTNEVINDSAKQNLGAVLNDLGDFQGAVAALKDVSARHPDWTFSAYALGTAYFKINDFENAAKTLRAIVDRGANNDPYYLPSLKNLGATEIKRKNGKEVKRVIELLKKVSPADALAMERDMKIAKL